MATILRSERTFKLEVVPEVDYAMKVGLEEYKLWSFKFCSSLKIDWDMPVFVIFDLSISADVMTLTFDLETHNSK